MFKKVLVLCFSGNRGGMELDAIRFCRRLSHYSETTLMGLKGSHIEKSSLIDLEKGFSYSFVGCSFSRFLVRSLFDLRLVVAVRTVLKNYSPDLIIFFGTSEVKSISLALYGLRTKLLIRIGTTINKPKSNWFQKMAYSRVDAFIATSDHIRKNILRSFPISANRLVKICYPVIQSNKYIVDRDQDPSVIEIIYHSRFVEGKGQRDAVQALHLLIESEPKVNLTLVGQFEDENYVREIQAYVQKYELETYIQILQERSDVPSLLIKSHIFLGPSYGEGFSNSFVEALSFGLICVVYDNTALSDFKNLGFDFILSDTGDIRSLSKSLARAIQAYRERKINISLNYDLIEELFSEQAEKRTLEEIYLTLNGLN